MVRQTKTEGSLETLTKETAEYYLSLNSKNRKINAKRVAKYLRDMNDGRWKVVPDAIGFNKEGALTNGQHRLQAFIKSELNTIQFFVVKGLEKSAFDVTDNGRPRSASDLLNSLGYKYANYLATSARYVYSFDTYGMNEASMGLRYQIGNNDIADTVEKHTGLVDCINTVLNLKKAGSRLIPDATFLSFVFYIYSSVGPSARERALGFITQVVTGVGLMENDPAYLLREKLFADQQSKRPMKRVERCAVILKAFNFYMKGQKIKQLRLGGNEGFPKFILKKNIKIEKD